MALTPTEAWHRAANSAQEPVFHVEIYDGTNTWEVTDRSMSSSSDLCRTPVGVKTVAPLGDVRDPFTRKITMTEIWVDFLDEFLRPLIVNYRLKGKKVAIKKGFSNLDESDFLAYVTNGVIFDFKPEPGGKIIRMILEGQFQMLGRTVVRSGYWLNKHPLECLYDGAGGGVLEIGGGISFDANSFDPTQAEYDDVDHLIASRADTRINRDIHTPGKATIPMPSEPAGWTGIGDDSPNALSMAQNICRLLNGHLVENEAGDLQFNRYDSSASADDNWTRDDFVPGSFKQTVIDENLVNRITIHFGPDPDGKFLASFTADDENSQGNHNFPGTSERVVEQSFDALWVGTPMRLKADINFASTSLTLEGVSCYALSGNKTGLTVDADHPIYLMLDSRMGSTVRVEVVKSTSIIKSTLNNGYVEVLAGGETWVQAGPFFAEVLCSNLTRNLFSMSPSAIAHYAGSPDDGQWETKVYDITALVLLLQELLARFADGCPIVEVSTLGWQKSWLNIGDMVTLTEPDFISYGKDGIDSGTKWEIIGKRDRDDKTAIDWTLAMVKTSSISFKTKSTVGASTIYQDAVALSHDQLATHFAVRHGLEVTGTGGLGIQVSGGLASNGIREVSLFNNRTRTLTASKDTYVYAEINHSPFLNIVYKETALGAGEPTPVRSTFMLLAKVVTGAAAVDSIGTDDRVESGRPTTVNGTVISEETMGVIAMAAGTVFGAPVNLNGNFSNKTRL